MTHDEMIAVIQAHKNGKKIQSRSIIDESEWMDCDVVIWSFYDDEYRIKPEPRELWIKYEYDEIFNEKPISCGTYIHVREVIEE